MAKLIAVLLAVAAVACSASPISPFQNNHKAKVGAWNPIQIADTYITLGESSHNPFTTNCSRYADLFLPDGTLHSPGIPDARGRTALINACNQDHAQINPLISFQTLNLPVMSWNTEKRLAFSWVLNGVRTRDGQDVFTPAISALFCDPNGMIQDAWSFYDDSQVTANVADPAPFNASKIVQLYTNLGGNGQSSALHNCTAWASLYTSQGINNEPGLPPSQGLQDLEILCNRRVGRWKLLLPSTQIVLPVMSWNTEKRLAFQWTITGVSQDSKSYVVPAITVLFLTPEGQIENAWDWWDESILPPPPLSTA